MAHHCQEHWASQHTWQTMPVEAEGQRSAGSGIWCPQSEQVGMVGSAIDAPGVRTIAGLQIVLAAGVALVNRDGCSWAHWIGPGELLVSSVPSLSNRGRFSAVIRA